MIPIASTVDSARAMSAAIAVSRGRCREWIRGYEKGLDRIYEREGEFDG